MSASLSSSDQTLVMSTKADKNERLVINDWTQTGRGFHVEFEYKESIPLEQGRFLGRGAMGEVYETKIQGHKVAHKRVVIKRKIGDIERREIEILKKLSSHNHMTQLVGTYTHHQFLGLLLYPVAICDLHTFFEDVEIWSSLNANLDNRQACLDVLETSHRTRLTALGYNFPTATQSFKASAAYSKMGCLISAIAYLHEQKIRHKDLKPSNVLLSKDRLWLSDFGSATDFSLLSQSATDNERGTPRYFSPEVAEWKANGRASDIFSLGCILLEIATLHDRGTLEHIRRNRSSDPAFHANLDQLDIWCTSLDKMSLRRRYLLEEIKLMLQKSPRQRPTAEQLLIRVNGYDSAMGSNQISIFGACCRKILVSAEQLAKEKLESEQERQIARTEQARIQKLYEEGQITINELSMKVSHGDQRIEQLERGNTEVHAQLNDLVAANTDLSNMRFQLAKTVAEIREEADNANRSNMILRDEILAINRLYQEREKVWEDSLKEEIETVEQSHRKERNKMEASWEKKIETVEQSHRNERKEWKASWKEEINTMEQLHEDERQKWEKERARLSADMTRSSKLANQSQISATLHRQIISLKSDLYANEGRYYEGLAELVAKKRQLTIDKDSTPGRSSEELRILQECILDVQKQIELLEKRRIGDTIIYGRLCASTDQIELDRVSTSDIITDSLESIDSSLDKGKGSWKDKRGFRFGGAFEKRR